MKGWCIVPSVIVQICVRMSAHERVVEGGRVRAKDKIIRNSILQARSGHRHVVETDVLGDGLIQLFVVIVLVGHEDQTDFVLPNCGHFTDTTQKDFTIWG